MKSKIINRLYKLSIVILIIASFFLLYLSVVGIIFFRKKDLKITFYNMNEYYIAYNKIDKEYKSISYNKNKLETLEKIENEMNVKCYLYFEKKLNDNYNGITYVTIRTIVLDETLEDYEYCVVLTHEMHHLKLYLAQEDYICFETFKYLYENKDTDLHNAGVWYAMQVLQFKYSGEYCIDYLIVDYLNNK